MTSSPALQLPKWFCLLTDAHCSRSVLDCGSPLPPWPQDHVRKKGEKITTQPSQCTTPDANRVRSHSPTPHYPDTDGIRSFPPAPRRSDANGVNHTSPGQRPGFIDYKDLPS